MALKFGTSGVRGLVTEMTDAECLLYSLAYARHLKASTKTKTVSLAGDLRNSTPRIKKAIAFALKSAGFVVDNCGDLPTGAITLHGMTNGNASIMVTGSHIPDDRNGIKFNMPSGEILKADEAEITRFYSAMKTKPLTDVFNDNGSFKQDTAIDLGPINKQPAEAYIDRYINFFPTDCLKGLKLVLYQHSAVGRDILLEILSRLGAEVIPVGSTDKFVAVDTEAVDDPEILHDWVKEHKVDALVSTDGDSDRPLLVDETGKVVRGDVLGIIVSSYLNADSVSTPVSCNTALEKCGKFSNISRTRIGSPYVIASMNEAVKNNYKTVVGYEANGGFLTATDITNPDTGNSLKALPTRDAALPLIAALLHAKNNNKTVSEIISELPPRYTMSGLLREFPNELGKKIVADFTKNGRQMADKYFKETFGDVKSLDFTDGARITFSGDDIVHLRPSGNAPEFRCYTESSVESRAEENNRKAMEIIQQSIRPNVHQ